MRVRPFGSLGTVSTVSLGGGGIGGVWGPTTREEAVATVHEAVEAGITLLDVAPAYGRGEAERVIGEAFVGALPAGVRVATKCALLAPWSVVKERVAAPDFGADALEAILRESVRDSLERLRLERIDLLFLHDQIVPDGPLGSAAEPGTPRSMFTDLVRPTLVRLVDDGTVGAWAISARGEFGALRATLAEEPLPAAAQVTINLLSSPAATGADWGAFELAELATQRGLGVMGIQPTQGGALTDHFDRPVNEASTALYARAAGFRWLAAELGMSPALLAHRYALSIPGVSTVTLGVKNRTELREALEAESLGPLPPRQLAQVEASV